jgi:hypothetical protein
MVMPARGKNETIHNASLEKDPFHMHQRELIRSDFHMNYHLGDMDEHTTKMVVCTVVSQIFSQEEFFKTLNLVKKLYSEFEEYLKYNDSVEFQIMIYTHDYIRNPYVIPEPIYRRFDYNLTKYLWTLTPQESLYLSMKKRLNNTNLPIFRSTDDEKKKAIYKHKLKKSKIWAVSPVESYKDIDLLNNMYVYESQAIQEKMKKVMERKDRNWMNDTEYNNHIGHQLHMWVEAHNQYLLINGKLMKDVWGGINPDVLLAPRNLWRMKKRLKYALEEHYSDGVSLPLRQQRIYGFRAPPVGDYSEIDYSWTDQNPISQDEIDEELNIREYHFGDIDPAALDPSFSFNIKRKQ